MSLDVYLTTNCRVLKEPTEKIFIREGGMTKEISLQEWNEINPDRDPVTLLVDSEEQGEEEVYWANITHNLGRMADEAGIYSCLWRPEEIGFTKAEQLIHPLSEGLKRMKENPTHYKQFSAENGWGTYDQFIPWIERYLNACIEYPDALIRVSG